MERSEVADAAKALDSVVSDVKVRFIEAREQTSSDGSGSRYGTTKRLPGRSLEARTRVVKRATSEEERVEIEKASNEPDANTRSNQISRDDYTTAFTELGAIEPVYDPEMLTLIFEHSNSLRQNVDAYATNIDGFGHRFDPIIDLEASDIDEIISDAMILDKLRSKGSSSQSAEEVTPPTEAEVKAEKDKIKSRMRVEKARLKYFFEYCSPEASFASLRRMTRQDLEVTGNGYWEVLRNLAGEIVQFIYIPSYTIRLLPLDPQPMLAKQKVRVSPLSFDEVEYTTRTRRYVQIVEGRAVMFKSFGDKRIISSESGLIFENVEALQAREPGVPQATEIIHFKIHSARSIYGVPRWIGNLLAVIGSRQAEEVNFNYFENKSVPPLAILISGGRMSSESVTRTQEYVEANIKGKRNFHKIMIIEAEATAGGATDNASKTKIDIKPLTGAQNNDAQFQNYDERNIDKVGQSFRLPRMLRGDIRDFNRATADAALTFAEMQVFQPERQDFDFIVNRKVLSELGIQFWELVSLAPVMRDPEAMSKVVQNLMNANILLPSEARELAGDVFNRELRKIRARWASQPPAFTLAGLDVTSDDPQVGQGAATGDNFGREGGEDAPARAPGEGIEASKRASKALVKVLKREAVRLLKLRDAMEAIDHDAWRNNLIEQALAESAA